MTRKDMTRKILVWDLPVRVFHWLLATAFVGAYVLSESERWRLVHVTLGYTVLALVVFRQVLVFVGTRDARFRSFASRKANEDALDALVAGWAERQHAPTALTTLQAAGVPAGLVLWASEVLADPHLKGRAYYAYLDHSEAGVRAYDGPPVRLSATPVEIRCAAPLYS